MLTSLVAAAVVAAPARPAVIFIHPDGTGLNAWTTARIALKGPDGQLNWDRLPHMAIYRGHMRDSLTASSNGGATAHAWGVRVGEQSFGNDNGKFIKSASGKSVSVLREALAAGFGGGVVNSASVTDAGTGAFLASVPARKDHAEIARQMMAARPTVILGGGEQWFLPKGVRGRHGEGMREDGRNLIQEAKVMGYHVVRDRSELGQIPKTASRILGLFAADDTFNDKPEEELAREGLPAYQTQAPTVGEMLACAIRILDRHRKGYLLIAEEEGTDNFAGENNASASFEAFRRADAAIGIALAYARTRPGALILTAADSDCGGAQVWAAESAERPLPDRDENGAPLDGVGGTGTKPFIAPSDRNGRRMPFAVAWASEGDVAGGIVARAYGRGAERVKGLIDNTDVYRILYRGVFGREPRGR